MDDEISITVSDIGNGLCKPSSNPGQDRFQFFVLMMLESQEYLSYPLAIGK